MAKRSWNLKAARLLSVVSPSMARVSSSWRIGSVHDPTVRGRLLGQVPGVHASLSEPRPKPLLSEGF
jgi:hypothetical protein